MAGEYVAVAPRTAVRFANYPGDRVAMLGGVYGPNTFGELLTVVDVDFDEASNTSRVGFAYATEADVKRVVEHQHTGMCELSRTAAAVVARRELSRLTAVA